MAFTNTGEWKPQNDGVANRIAKITSSNSPMMKQARTSGMQVANRRGLGNSSMAAQASEAAAISAAAPVAAQEAGQIAQKNLAVLDGGIKTDQLGMQLAAAEREMLARSITDITGQRFGAFSNTLNNADIPASARAGVQGSINDQAQSALNYLQNLYGVSVNDRTPGTGTTTANAAVAPPFTIGPNGQLVFTGNGGLGAGYGTY